MWTPEKGVDEFFAKIKGQIKAEQEKIGEADFRFWRNRPVRGPKGVVACESLGILNRADGRRAGIYSRLMSTRKLAVPSPHAAHKTRRSK